MPNFSLISNNIFPYFQNGSNNNSKLRSQLKCDMISFTSRTNITDENMNSENNINSDNNVFDVGLTDEYPSNVLSNLAYKPFVIDGIPCASLEGFLQALKSDNKELQCEICRLYGMPAKRMSWKLKKWRNTQKIYWNGTEYERNSEQYRKLLERAFMQCYKENPEFKTALESIKDKKIIHSIGKSNPSETILTEQEFVEILTMLRDELD